MTGLFNNFGEILSLNKSVFFDVNSNKVLHALDYGIL